jgi:hypothetical protein
MSGADLLRDEESLPCVAPRVLRFAGGVVELKGVPSAHPGGVTPSTFVEPSREARAVAFLELAMEKLHESQLAGSPTARRLLVLGAQGCVDSALGLLK